MKYSFIIPTHNSESTILKCITSIKKQNCEKEIIVVNDNSTDSTCNIIQNNFAWIKIYSVNYKSAAKARNFGANQAKYNYIVFVDSDIILGGDWIDKMKKRIKTYDMVMGGKENSREMSLGIFNFRPPENFTLIKKDVFEKINGYKECYKKSGGEDVDLLLRILKKKYKVFYQNVDFLHLTRTNLKKKLFRICSNFKTNFNNLDTLICWYWLARKLSGLIFFVLIYNFLKKTNQNENSSHYRKFSSKSLRRSRN